MTTTVDEAVRDIIEASKATRECGYSAALTDVRQVLIRWASEAKLKALTTPGWAPDPLDLLLLLESELSALQDRNIRQKGGAE